MKLSFISLHVEELFQDRLRAKCNRYLLRDDVTKPVVEVELIVEVEQIET